MLWCMPEADDWQLERDYIRKIYDDLYDHYLLSKRQYKNTQSENIYKAARAIYRSEKRKFRKAWKKMSEEQRTRMAEEHWDVNDHPLFKCMKPFVFT